jgi:hypothetical protein
MFEPVASLSNRFRVVLRRAERIAPDVVLVEVLNDPRDLDEDTGEIPIKGKAAGEIVRREPNESYPSFHDRLRTMARERGMGVAIVGSGKARPPRLRPSGLVKITERGAGLAKPAGGPLDGF